MSNYHEHISRDSQSQISDATQPASKLALYLC